MSDIDADDDMSNDCQDDDKDSDEDTEDASETDMVKYDGEYPEIKEQMYQDKLANLKEQLIQLEQGYHPDYVRRIKRLEQIYEDRILLNEAFLTFETSRIEREYKNEKKASLREFEERKIELRESLIIELEEKRRCIENERIITELTNDSSEPKPVTTRKLRRRPNDPIPLPEKRRRASPAQLNHMLDENDILEDLKMLNKAVTNKCVYDSQPESDHSPTLYDARIEDGKLFYDKKWFHRGQLVTVESKDYPKFNGVLVSIGTSEVWVKKNGDNTKCKVYLSNLQKGKFTLQRRAS